MPTAQDQRPRYYEGQFLGAEDLMQAVEYARVQDAARHALAAHTWGIAIGLDLKETPLAGSAGVSMSITPGYARDGFGRALVGLAPTKVPADLFSTVPYDPLIDAAGTGRRYGVWLRYDEALGGAAAPGFGDCDETGADKHARVRETFRVVVSVNKPNPAHDPVSLAGADVAPADALNHFDPADPPLVDESVPHQTFPEQDQPAQWLIFVGYVRWLPSPIGPGRFVARVKPDDVNLGQAERRYIGAVAAAVHPADKMLRVRHRKTDPAKSHFTEPDDLLWVEGDLHVEGQTRVCKQLEFRDPDGKDNGARLEIRRGGTPAADRALQVALGAAGAAETHRFSVGPINAGVVDEKFVVTNAGKVGIGTAAPAAPLHIANGGNVVIQAAAGDTVGDVLFRNAAGTQKGRIWTKPAANAVLLLSAAGAAEALAIDDAGRVGIGTDAPLARLQVHGNIRLGAAGELFSPGSEENLRIVRGCVSGAGAKVSGAGIDPHRDAEGLYTIKFTPPFASQPAATVTVVHPSFGAFSNAGNTRDNAVITGIAADRMVVKTGDANGNAKDRDFTFIVTGPR